MHVTEINHPDQPNLKRLTLVLDDGRQHPLMTITTITRPQAMMMREELSLTGYRYCCRYMNNSIERDLYEFLDHVEQHKLQFNKVTRIHSDGVVWQFFGGLQGRSQDFCFMILDPAVAYEVMERTGADHEAVIKAFLGQHKFAAYPELTFNQVRFKATVDRNKPPAIPRMFEQVGETSWIHRASRTTIRFGNGVLELIRTLLPEIKKGARPT